MARQVVPLSDLKIKSAKPREKEYKLFDGGGLYLAVTPSGGKLWRCKYTIDGKERQVSFGLYPEVPLAEARRRRDDARSNVAHGVDPMDVKRAKVAARYAVTENSLEVVARAWYAVNVERWSPSYARVVLGRLEMNVFPYLGEMAVADVSLRDIKGVLERVEDRAPESARRVLVILQMLFRYCVVKSYILRSPLEGLKPRDLLVRVPIVKHYPAITDPKALGSFLCAVEGFTGSFVVKCALQLSPLLFQRPGDLRCMEWVDLDFERCEWNIPYEKMKLTKKQKAEREGETHCVPLCRQAVEILRRIQPLTRRSRFVFHCHRTVLKPMSDAAVTAALHRMGYHGEMSWHGFRATARTLLDEVLEFPADIIEHQLAHAVRDPLGRAYNRTTKLPQRRVMMQAWGDYLEGLRG